MRSSHDLREAFCVAACDTDIFVPHVGSIVSSQSKTKQVSWRHSQLAKVSHMPRVCLWSYPLAECRMNRSPAGPALTKATPVCQAHPRPGELKATRRKRTLSLSLRPTPRSCASGRPSPASIRSDPAQAAPPWSPEVLAQKATAEEERPPAQL